MCSGQALRAYLLGSVDFEKALLLQRRLHYDVAGDGTQAALVVCEHESLITVGRQGSRRHLLFEAEELRARQWRVRWVNRAGGCWLHLPGQLSIYPILSLEHLGLSAPDYVAALGEALRRVLEDFSIGGKLLVDDAGVWVGGRLLAAIGVAIKDGVTYYGACLNVQPSLDACRLVRSHPRVYEPMTSLARERRGPVRLALVRERLLEHCRDCFGFARLSLFQDHPMLHSPAASGRKQRPLASRI